jgi:hypothetical protein
MHLMTKRILSFLAACWGVFQLSSCKENTILPSDLIPAIDNISTFQSDTFTVISHNIYQDSALTGGLSGTSRISNAPTYYHALGCILADPAFGKTSGAIHVEVLPPVSNFAFKTDYPGTTRTIDSVILSIPFKSSYGDTLNPQFQTYRLYRSLKTFSRDSAQYDFTRDSFKTSDILATTQVNYANFRFDTLYGSVKQSPTLHFKLASWFADSLQAQVDAGTAGAAVDFSSFLSWWKGFAIMPDTNSGATIGYFDTYNTRLKIYYRHTNTNNLLDTVADVFSFDPNYCNRFNSIFRNYSGSVSSSQINSNALSGDSVLFIQNEPGLSGLIQFPFLYQQENVIVNKAELIFTAVSPYYNWVDTTIYGMTPRLQILATDLQGTDRIPDDYGVFGTSFVDGTRKIKSIGGVNFIQYKFGLNQSIQQIISRKDSTFRFKIMGLNLGLPAVYRVLLQGSGSSVAALRPKLNIIYTKIQK